MILLKVIKSFHPIPTTIIHWSQSSCIIVHRVVKGSQRSREPEVSACRQNSPITDSRWKGTDVSASRRCHGEAECGGCVGGDSHSVKKEKTESLFSGLLWRCALHQVTKGVGLPSVTSVCPAGESPHTADWLVRSVTMWINAASGISEWRGTGRHRVITVQAGKDTAVVLR